MFNIFSKFFNIYSQITLSYQERDFILSNKIFNQNLEKKNKVFLIQGFWNYYYLLLFKFLIFKEKTNYNYKIIVIWPINLLPRKEIDNIFFFRKLKKFYYNLIRKKWSKLYFSIGASKVYTLKPSNLSVRKKNFLKSKEIFSNIKSKEDLINLKYDNVLIGDLVYDSYLRFAFKATVNLKDPFLIKCIYTAINAFSVAEKLNKDYDIETYFSSYSVYVHHGIIIRYLLFKSSSKVFTFGNMLYSVKKRLSKKDYLDTHSYKSFKKKFETLENKSKKIKLAKIELNKKFLGKDDFSTRNDFLPINTYKSKKKVDIKKLSEIEGVLFLHDFFDGPHMNGNMIYPDFYEWATDTMNEIQSNKLKIAIKSHPNSRLESLKINDLLQNKYKELIWLDKDLSNQIIFKQKNIKYGISCIGSVLYEMSYHNKVVLSAGPNSTSSFNFALNPKNKAQYKYYLENLKKYKPKKNQVNEVCKLYYMYFLDEYYSCRNKNFIFLNNINVIKLLYDDTGNIKKYDNIINKSLSS